VAPTTSGAASRAFGGTDGCRTRLSAPRHSGLKSTTGGSRGASSRMARSGGGCYIINRITDGIVWPAPGGAGCAWVRPWGAGCGCACAVTVSLGLLARSSRALRLRPYAIAYLDY